MSSYKYKVARKTLRAAMKFKYSIKSIPEIFFPVLFNVMPTKQHMDALDMVIDGMYEILNTSGRY